MVWHPRTLARKATNRLAGPYVAQLAERVEELGAPIADLRHSIEVLKAEISQMRSEAYEARGQIPALDDRVGALSEQISRLQLLLRHVYEEDPVQRARLYALREQEDYELAFTETEPLVSFIVPTYKRFEGLRDVSLPSILNQSYANVEVIVAGDGSPPQTEQVIAELDDPRIRFHNRSVRGPYPEDETVRWYMIGTPPFNDGLALARGRWIAALGDDDALRPEHTEVLLEAAQKHRYEHCYGRHEVHYPNGETLQVGSFPPSKGEYVLQSSLYHAGLRFFQMEPADYLSAEPNDWSLCRRMLAAGVRFGMVDAFLADKYESRYQAHADWSVHGAPSVE